MTIYTPLSEAVYIYEQAKEDMFSDIRNILIRSETFVKNENFFKSIVKNHPCYKLLVMLYNTTCDAETTFDTLPEEDKGNMIQFYIDLIESDKMSVGTKPHVIFTVGISGSGKSEWTKRMINKYADLVQIERSDIFFRLFNNGVKDFNKICLKNDKTRWVNKERNKMIMKAIVLGQSIIFSDTNLQVKYIKNLRNMLPSYYVPKVKIFDIPLEEAINKSSTNPTSVCPEVIEKQHKRFLKILPRLEQIF